MNQDPAAQYVCLVCGYNMVGYHPEYCPFCGSPSSRFITMEECMHRFTVQGTRVNEYVTRMNSQPSLGLEHAAYAVETDEGRNWVDCPSSFTPTLPPARHILFTHPHFLGANNLYRKRFSAHVLIHDEDVKNPLCRGFTFDRTFRDRQEEQGFHVIPIGGHTPGFTVYLFRTTLFVCDYVIRYSSGEMIFNPYGPAKETAQRASGIAAIFEEYPISHICGWNYTEEAGPWKRALEGLLHKRERR